MFNPASAPPPRCLPVSRAAPPPPPQNAPPLSTFFALSKTKKLAPLNFGGTKFNGAEGVCLVKSLPLLPRPPRLLPIRPPARMRRRIARRKTLHRFLLHNVHRHLAHLL